MADSRLYKHGAGGRAVLAERRRGAFSHPQKKDPGSPIAHCYFRFSEGDREIDGVAPPASSSDPCR